MLSVLPTESGGLYKQASPGITISGEMYFVVPFFSSAMPGIQDSASEYSRLPLLLVFTPSQKTTSKEDRLIWYARTCWQDRTFSRRQLLTSRKSRPWSRQILCAWVMMSQPRYLVVSSVRSDWRSCQTEASAGRSATCESQNECSPWEGMPSRGTSCQPCG